MIKAKTRILKILTSRYFLVPNALVKDSQFPFDDKDTLMIEICNKECIIKKFKK